MTQPGVDPLEGRFREYVRDKKILVADACASTRAGLAKTMTDLGAPAANVKLVTSLATAETEIRRLKPHVVITDYNLGPRCGLSLLQTQRESNPEARACLFILVTANSSQSALAQAAEEDVDTYVLKPFTLASLRASILKAAQAKLNPSDYAREIEEGKRFLFESKPDESAMCFERAQKMSDKPTLACFYYGQSQLLKQALDTAQASFQRGLEYNKIHYKCMVGLFEVLTRKQNYSEAYEVMKRMSRYYPTNPTRLTTVLRLAIMTKHYEDIERYYLSFKELEVQDEELVKYVCAALVVVGKHYLASTFVLRALELFDKAALSGGHRPRILREIINSLIEANLPKEAAAYLARFPADRRKHPDYLVSQLAVADFSQTARHMLEQGEALIAQGVQDPQLYKILIKRAWESGRREEAAEFTRKAAELWPTQKAEFATAMHVPAAPASS